MDEDALYEDESSDDIPENTQSGGAQSQIAKEKGRVQVANEAEEDDEFLDEESPEPSFPAHLNIVIEKVCSQGVSLMVGSLLNNCS